MAKLIRLSFSDFSRLTLAPQTFSGSIFYSKQNNAYLGYDNRTVAGSVLRTFDNLEELKVHYLYGKSLEEIEIMKLTYRKYDWPEYQMYQEESWYDDEAYYDPESDVTFIPIFRKFIYEQERDIESPYSTDSTEK